MKIDLNADLGESFGEWKMGHDSAMLELVSSANIACGFHAGDPLVMLQTAQKCLEKGVSIGAHPGFQDLQGFGRRRISGIPPQELHAMLIYQIGALQSIVQSLGSTLHHIKPHGALSNMCCEDPVLAQICVRAARSVSPQAMILAVAGTALAKATIAANAPIAHEVFADRAYLPNGQLVPRNQEGAVLHNPNQAAERVLEMLETSMITAINGDKLPIKIDSICVHGDHEGAVKMTETLRDTLEKAGYQIVPFSRLN